MIDAMFQEGTDKVLDDRVARPVLQPPDRPSFGASLWNTTKAPVKGIGAGATESAAFGADMLGAFGSVQAAYGVAADPAMLFDTDMQERQRVEGAKARADIQSGEAFSTDTGTNLRTTARSMVPDPATSNVAENVLFGLGRFATKAVGYSVAGGPVAGAVLTGTDEGLTEADRLKAQGVDITTRTKVGIVAGGAAAAATLLPVAGKTVAQTAGLVAAGGPGAFIAQQAASRSILQNADYKQISEQYDPFDPVGLAVATLVPAGFGAYASRGAHGARPAAAPVDAAAARPLLDMGRNERTALRYDDSRLDDYVTVAAQREGVPPELLLALKNAGEKSGPTAVSPKGASGVAQLMPENQVKYGVKDPKDPVQSIDGMAKYVRDTMKQYDGNIQAVIADYNGGPRQAKAVMAGKAPAATETVNYLKRVNDYMGERQGTESGRLAAHDPEAVAAARVNLARETIDSMNLKDPSDLAGAEQHMNALLKASDQIGAGERVEVADATMLDAFIPVTQRSEFRDWFASSKVVDAEGQPMTVYHGTASDFKTFAEGKGNAEGFHFTTDPAVANQYAASRAMDGGRGANVQPAYLSLQNPKRTPLGSTLDIREAIAEGHDGLIVGNGNHIVAFNPEQIRSTMSSKSDFENFREGIDRVRQQRKEASVSSSARAPESAKSGTETKAAEPATTAPNTGTEPAISATNTPESGKAAVAALDSQTTEISKAMPDLMVQLEGMEKPMPLSEALAQVKAEAVREKQDAGLLQVAAECFLRNG